MSTCRFCDGTGMCPSAPTVAVGDTDRCEYMCDGDNQCILTEHGPTYAHRLSPSPLVFVDDEGSDQ